MPDIVLATLNARYAHASFGLRSLRANLGELRDRSRLMEFELNRAPLEIVDAILEQAPRIVGFGVYIWNVSQISAVLSALRRLDRDIVVVLGGPEVRDLQDLPPAIDFADYVIAGEGDVAFRSLCHELLEGRFPEPRHFMAEVPDFRALALPYEEYTDEDIAHRVIYVEASRGCPYRCEFCLSSLDRSVRRADLDAFLASIGRLLDRGARKLKFVDRTFNLDPTAVRRILEYFLAEMREDLFLHFEMVPDRFDDSLRELVSRFPPGSLQFEVGIQSFDPEVCQRISRRLDVPRVVENFHFLREKTTVHVHADLIVGLPGETLQQFARGFDRLVALAPQEIQVGILKRLRGTPIVAREAAYSMIYSEHPPYEILQTSTMSFETIRTLERLARYWELYSNSGNFLTTLPLLWREEEASPFARFSRFSDWLFERTSRHHGLSLHTLMEHLFTYLRDEVRLDPEEIASKLWNDYRAGGRSDKPSFLRPWIAEASTSTDRSSNRGAERQFRHQRRAEES